MLTPASVFNPVEILAELVATPSVNRMGRPLDGPEFGEARLTAFLEGTARRLGLRTVRQQVAAGQDNLLLWIEGQPAPPDGGRIILLDAHQDTVPVDGMTIDPFGGQQRDGRLYGRGACDVKGGMAAMLAAVARLSVGPACRAGQGNQPSQRPTIVLSCTVNEEYGFSGVRRLVESWSGGQGWPWTGRPDLAIVAEPTGLDIVVAHKGVLRWRCHTRGRAAHSSRPELGENAIYKMGRVLAALERFPADVLAGLPEHPLCGRSTLCVGTITGGISANTVPDRATIEIERRFPPGEDAAEIQRQVTQYLEATASAAGPLSHDPPYMLGLALSEAAGAALARSLDPVVRQRAGRCALIGVPYATNAAFIAAAGVPTVVFGPGCLEQAHTVDEWIDVEQLRQAADIYEEFLKTCPELLRTRRE